MKRKTRILSGCIVVMTAMLVTGCGKRVIASTQTSAETKEEMTQEMVTATGGLRTGLSVQTSISGSSSATADADGNVQVDVTLVSVTVDDLDVIQSCAIDGLQVNVSVNGEGQLTTNLETVFESKNALGKDYGMHQISSIGKEWNEQAAAMAEYAVGKTVSELKTMAVNESGAPDEADLTASVTIRVADFITGIEDAVNKAQK